MDWLLNILDPANISAFFTQFQAEMQQPAFWVALGKIMWINILLSGDNALVIAMACRGPAAAAAVLGHGARRRRCRFPAHHLHRHRRDADGTAVPQAGRRAGAARDRGKVAGA